MHGAGKGDDRLDGRDLRKQGVVETLLVMDHGVGIHEEPLHLVERLDDLAGRPAPPGVVKLLGKVGPVRLEGHLPGVVMEAHGVG